MNETNVKLSTGAIQEILDGVKVDKPVLQILNIKQLSNSGRLRIDISDGVANSSFAMLATELSHHFDDGSLDKYAVIRADEYICNTTQMQEKSKRIIIILNYTLLVSGVKIGDKIGNPINVESSGPNNNVSTNMNDTNVKLSTGSIQEILNGVTVDKPVLQILNIKRISGEGSSSGGIRISLSDGVANSSFAMLATQLSHHLDDGSLDKYAVIRVNQYVCNDTLKIRRIIIILNYTLLVSGMKIGEKIGNPIPVESSVPNNNDPPKATSESQQAAATNRFHFSNIKCEVKNGTIIIKDPQQAELLNLATALNLDIVIQTASSIEN